MPSSGNWGSTCTPPIPPPPQEGELERPLPQASVQVTVGPRKPSFPTRRPCTPLPPSVTSTAVTTAASRPRALTGPWTERGEGSRCAFRDSCGHTVRPAGAAHNVCAGDQGGWWGRGACREQGTQNRRELCLLSCQLVISSVTGSPSPRPGPAAPPRLPEESAGWHLSHVRAPPLPKGPRSLAKFQASRCPRGGPPPPLLWTMTLLSPRRSSARGQPAAPIPWAVSPPTREPGSGWAGNAGSEGDVLGVYK